MLEIDPCARPKIRGDGDDRTRIFGVDYANARDGRSFCDACEGRCASGVDADYV